MISLNKEKVVLAVKILIIFSIAFMVILIFCHQSELTSLDLGRHIKNGEIVWQDKQVLYKNFYSFTEPDFPFINHHWLSGVVLYWLYLLGGFKLLSIFNIFIALLTIGIVFWHALKRSNFWLACIIILPVILIMSERTNIRPETFSYLFLVITFYLLDQFRKKENYKKLLWLLPLMLLWVNLHIYFFLGLFLISLALLEKIILQILKVKKILPVFKKYKKLFFVTLGCYLASLINPNFLKNAIYPLNILKKYGYEIVENKSPFYLENLMINYNITIFKILLIVFTLSFIIAIIVKLPAVKTAKEYKPGSQPEAASITIFDLIISLFFTSAALFAIRNFPMFALIMLPIASCNFYSFNQLKKFKFRAKQPLANYSFIGALLIVAIYAIIIYSLILDTKGEGKYLKYQPGIGLAQGVDGSIKFYRDNNLAGPIFNNYDLGSALAFWLYGEERVFVDNRPEAYSIEFFQTIYKPMQQDNEKWQEFSEKYNINLIYFSHTDGTPWANEFLYARLHDQEWPLIYFDRYVVIMVKNKEASLSLIDQYKINNEKFASRLKSLTVKANNKTLISLADLAKLYGRRDLAQEIYEEILSRQPDNEQVLALMGYLLSNSQKNETLVGALNYFNKAISLGYKLPGVYNQMGLNYWGLGDYSGANKMWQNALELDSSNEHAKYYLKQSSELLK